MKRSLARVALVSLVALVLAYGGAALLRFEAEQTAVVDAGGIGGSRGPTGPTGSAGSEGATGATGPNWTTCAEADASLGAGETTGTCGDVVFSVAPAFTGNVTGDRITLTSTSGTALTATGQGTGNFGGAFTGSATAGANNWAAAGVRGVGGAAGGAGAYVTGTSGYAGIWAENDSNGRAAVFDGDADGTRATIGLISQNTDPSAASLAGDMFVCDGSAACGGRVMFKVARNTSSATWRGIGDHKHNVVDNTATLALAGEDQQIRYTNAGDTDGSTFNLPSAVKGDTFTFCVYAAQTMTITAASGDIIRIGANVGTAAGSTTSNTVGSCLKLTALDTTYWFAEYATGTWTNPT